MWCYRQLIERCWSPDPKQRPTFDEILHELKSNPEFIESTTDKENFIEYTKYIDGYPSTFDPSKHINQLDDISIDSFPDIRPNILKDSVYETEINNVIFNEADKIIYNFNIKKDYKFNLCKINTNNVLFNPGGKFKQSLNIQGRIKGNFYEIKIIRKSLISRTAIKQYDNFFKNEIVNFSRELNILLQIKHPSILEFYGFRLNNKYPQILCKYSRKGSLGKFLENERMNNTRNKMPTHKPYIYPIPQDLSFFDNAQNANTNVHNESSLTNDNKDIEYLTDT